jgi:hypothetical protein
VFSVAVAIEAEWITIAVRFLFRTGGDVNTTQGYFYCQAIKQELLTILNTHKVKSSINLSHFIYWPYVSVVSAELDRHSLSFLHILEYREGELIHFPSRTTNMLIISGKVNT